MNRIKSYLYSLSKKFITMKRPKLIIFSSIAFIIISAVTYSVFAAPYTVSPKIVSGSNMISDDALWCVEIFNPKKAYTAFESSEFGKTVLSSGEWRKQLESSQAGGKLAALYFVQLKGDSWFTLSNLSSCFEGSMCIAALPEGYVAAGKLNVKSTFGLNIISSLKGTKTKLQTDSDSSSSVKNNNAADNNFKNLFSEEEEKLSSLSVTKIVYGSGTVYMVILDGWLFVSDSIDAMKKTLSLASNNKNNSLYNSKNYNLSVQSAGESGIVFYASKSSFAAPFISSTVSAEGLAFSLNPDEAPKGNIFAIGGGKSVKKETVNGDLLKAVPADQTMSLLLSAKTVQSVSSDLSSGKSDSPKISSAIQSFLAAAGLDASDLSSKEGISVSMSGFKVSKSDKMIYPQGSVFIHSANCGEKLLKAIFKTANRRKNNFGGALYVSAPADNGNHYSPCYYENKDWTLFSSASEETEKYISSSKGNIRTIGDAKSFSLIGSDASRPNHFLIHIPSFLNAVSDFAMYGAMKTGEYTEKTVNSDILPLFDPFKKYEYFHIAWGDDSVKAGTFIFSVK
ncbi:MAG TPA: hypothetical protein PLA54_00755 [Spirochaetota bacterium]|nr:hypothetical protein [Spirochaetota bacterium]HQE57699.1 hypothetical protein [Spirochaetota bacterium]